MTKNQTISPNNEIDAEALIEAFGGIRPMAQKLDIAVSTVQGWKSRNHIPPSRMDEILAVAETENIDVGSLPKITTIDGEAIILDDKSTGDVGNESNSNSTAESAKDAKAEKTTLRQPAPAQSATEVASRGGSSIAWLALIVAVGVGGAVLTRPAWAPVVEPKIAPYLQKFMPQNPEAVIPEVPTHNHDALVAQNADLVKRLAALENLVAELPKTPTLDEDRLNNVTADAVDALDDRLIDLNTEIDDLTTEMGQLLARIDEGQPYEGAREVTVTNSDDILNQLSELALAQDAFKRQLDELPRQDGADDAIIRELEIVIDSLNEKINLLDSQVSDIATMPSTAPGQNAATLVVAIGQLETKALSGGAFINSLKSLKALASDNDIFTSDIATMNTHAELGVATRRELTRRFAAIAPVADASYRKANAQDWVDATLENIRGLVSIRKIGEDPDLPPVSRAEAAVERGDLSAAITAAQELSDSELVSNWLIDATARLSVEEALKSLRANAVSLLADVNAESGQ